MKQGIHPDYELTKITCACGNVIETRSTVKNIHVEICSACHPFFTGKQKLVDTAGRIERFNKRFKIIFHHGNRHSRLSNGLFFVRIQMLFLHH